MGQWRRWLAVVLAALVAACLLAAVFAGCGPGDLVGLLADPTGVGSSPVSPRLTGGSVPGGEIVCGYVVPHYGGVGARSTGDDDGPVMVSLITAKGQTQVDEADEEGWFGFTSAEPGESKLEFAPPSGGERTRITVEVKDDQRIQLISGLVPDSEEGERRERSKVKLYADAERVEAETNEPLVIKAKIDGLSQPDAQLVWVMETKTDCKLVPTSATDVVLLYAGKIPGKAEVRAELPDDKSDHLELRVIAPGDDDDDDDDDDD